jgi:hypothetical protein
MTLWINGDWVTGLGERRVKTNPVGGDVLWHGNDADATQVTQRARLRVQLLPVGLNSPSVNARRLLKSLLHCWKAISPS